MQRKQPRVILYPNQKKFPGAQITVPPEWLGEHLLRRDAAQAAAARFKNDRITVAAVALAILDGWENIPGIEGDDPAAWHFEKVPNAILCWLEVVVWNSFMESFVIPKASASPLPNGPRVTRRLRRRRTAGI